MNGVVDVSWLAEAIVSVYGEHLYHGGPGGPVELNDATLASFRERGVEAVAGYRDEPSTYLTSDIEMALRYAEANDPASPGPVFRVRVRDLDPDLLRGDEWHLLPDPRYPEWEEADADMMFPADGFADPDDVLASLNISGQLCYMGSIPADALELVAGHGAGNPSAAGWRSNR